MTDEINHIGTVHVASLLPRRSFLETPSPFERKLGYYRGVRHGNHIFISGTTAVDPTSHVEAPQVRYPGDAARQARVAFSECIYAVRSLGGDGPNSVVRVRMFVGRHEDCGAVQTVFREVFGGSEDNLKVGVAATMLVVQNGFVDRDMLVEVEVDAMAD